MGGNIPKYPDLKLSVCALGDSSDIYFAQCRRGFDEAFGNLGARRVMNRLDCAEDVDDPF